MDSRAHYVVTPWRSRQELLDVRHALYGSDAVRRESAVNKVFAWRSRKPAGLPLLLDSTADIVDVILQDEKNELKHNAVRLLYATALSRFVTGLADTQIDLTRDKPSWFPPGKTIQLPLQLLELRHRIVHRHLPSLAELKRAAQESLDWLWKWYWKQLDYAFGIAKPDDLEAEVESIEAIKEKLHSILKMYIKERKTEIKTRKKDSKAAETAMSTYKLRYDPSNTSTSSTRTQTQLLQLLLDEKMILPTDKKLGSSMSGAFLIWTPFLLAFTQDSTPLVPVSMLLDRLIRAMNASASPQATTLIELDPVREGFYAWASHILLSEEWQAIRIQHAPQLVEDILTACFSAPTHWNLKLASAVVENNDVPNREQWVAVLSAAKSDDAIDLAKEEGEEGENMDIDVEHIDSSQPVKTVLHQDVEFKKAEKIRGPRKAVGMWRNRPIGWRPEGWEDDE